ncbi:MAG: cytochrome c [Planctomycetes bacterium]|nr:cytochrome c [Planctomycetota bacterium]
MAEPVREPLSLYLDDAEEPFKVAIPPVRFRLSTLPLSDGPHELRIVASNGLAPPTVRRIPFHVRNGVAVSVSGLQPGQVVGGQVQLIANAFAGSSEAEFEPRKAETPEPIPRWTWVLLLGVATWAFAYVLRLGVPTLSSPVPATVVQADIGAQRVQDVCARCHGEDGRGRRLASDASVALVPPLRDTPFLAVDRDPERLLARVLVGVPDTAMPAWAAQWPLHEVVAVVNHLRHTWGHDASRIHLDHRAPPSDVVEAEALLRQAIERKDADAVAAAWAPTGRTTSFRADDDAGGVTARGDIRTRWSEYFTELGPARSLSIELFDTRYDYEPASVTAEGSLVVSLGRVRQVVTGSDGAELAVEGDLLRGWRLRQGRWALVMDVATTPLRVGLEARATPPPSERRARTGPTKTLGPLGYAEVRAMFEGLGRSAKSAPHGTFWRLDYQAFVNQVFEYELPDAIARVRMVVPYDSARSNLLRAVRDGKRMICGLPGGQLREVDIRRMPVGVTPLDDVQIDALAAWIDAGCPERAGEPSALPRRPADQLLQADR